MIQRLQLSICVLCSAHYSRQEPSLLFLFVLDLALYLPLPGAVYIQYTVTVYITTKVSVFCAPCAHIRKVTSK